MRTLYTLLSVLVLLSLAGVAGAQAIPGTSGTVQAPGGSTIATLANFSQIGLYAWQAELTFAGSGITAPIEFHYDPVFGIWGAWAFGTSFELTLSYSFWVPTGTGVDYAFGFTFTAFGGGTIMITS